ncbi:MAG: holo-ACP synthase [Elusimicrobiota bacterium]
MTFLRTGTDIVRVQRITDILKNRKNFKEKILTDRELEYCNSFKNSDIHVAGRFAAKEAVYKALNSKTEKFFWKDIEILNDSTGRPKISRESNIMELIKRKNLNYSVSISHEAKYAVAFAVFKEKV